MASPAKDPKATEYWKHSEDGHICVDAPCSEDSIPLIGYFTGDEDFIVIVRIGGLQEDALEADKYDYITPNEIPLSTAEKRAILMEKRNEKANYELSDIYRNVPILTVSEFMERTRTFNGNSVYDSSVFLPIDMPREFGYTGVFLLNNAYQGVLHTFLRHHLQWQTMVPYVETAISRLKPLHFYIDLVSKAHNMKDSRKALSNFLQALKALTRDEYNECQSALNEVQLELVRYLQSKMLYSNYRGEGLNEKTQMEVYFRMQEGIIAVMGFSRELFKPVNTFRSYKPVRALVTIFFIDPEEQSKRLVVKSY